MTTIHDVPTMAYPIPRRVADPAPPVLAAERRSFFKALALVVLAVGVIGAAIVAVTAFLVFPPPAHMVVVTPTPTATPVP